MVRIEDRLHMNQRRTARLEIIMISKDTIKLNGIRKLNPSESRFSSGLSQLKIAQGRIMISKNPN